MPARNHRLLVVFVALAFVVVACDRGSSKAATHHPAPSTHPARAPSVPAKYQSEYDQTAAGLTAFGRAIDVMPDLGKPPKGQLGFVELLDANGNRQSALLQPNAMAAIDRSLDAFKRLGVRGVVLGVKLPLLLPSFTPQSAQYARFWATVADHARAHGFVVDVELGPLFCGTVYSRCSYQYPTTVAGWAQLTAQQARTVIDQIHPDYLDLISEPNTEANLTRIPALESVPGFTAFVTDALAALGAHGSTKVVAGAASWFPVKYDQAIIGSGIDGLVTHIYPAGAGTAANLIATSTLAHDAGKPMIADETWLYKGTTTASGNVQATNQQGSLNCFSFWEPLDVRFMQATREWATKAGILLVSGFWSNETLAYSTWTPQLDAESSLQIQAQTTAAAVAAMPAGTFTHTGLALVGQKVDQ